jgi:MoaA/NifB/PqqE/SkfB family radical SAM enzyme
MSEKANPTSLASITAQPFEGNAEREPTFVFGALATTEVCNLECVMCHFNGPNAIKKGKQLSPENVERVLNQLPRGSHVYLAATGDYFMDPNAIQHIEYAISRNLKPQILSHGQLYTGVARSVIINGSS